MKTDDVIDNVARRMTETDGRPDLRMRVMTGIGDEARVVRRHWLAPALAGGAVACAALMWLLTPAPMQEAPASAVTTTRVVTPPAPATMREAVPTPEAPSAAVVTARASMSRPVTRRAVTEASVESTTWADAPVEWTIPALPPLAGPPPIVIEPIAWDEVTIAPLAVALIEVKALEIEPLEARGRGGA